MEALDSEKRKAKVRLEVELESRRYLQDISVLRHRDKHFSMPMHYTDSWDDTMCIRFYGTAKVEL